MSDVTVIGLGSMGTTLAGVLLAKNRHVCVWNRTPERANSLVARGATKAASFVDAIIASPVVIVCLANYEAAQELFTSADAATALSDRVLVQLTTGTPTEAEALGAWASAQGAQYLDGAIMAYPSEIGTEGASIFCGGSADGWAKAQMLLRDLAGQLQYLGPKPRAAAAFDLAQLCFGLGYNMGILHGALICESEGISVGAYGASFTAVTGRMVAERVRRRAEIIHRGDFTGTGASIGVWNEIVQRIEEQAKEKRVNAEFPYFVSNLLKRAIESGFGDEDITAAIKVLRNPSN